MDEKIFNELVEIIEINIRKIVKLESDILVLSENCTTILKKHDETIGKIIILIGQLHHLEDESLEDRIKNAN